MVNTSADDLDTIEDDHPIMRPDHGQEMSEHTPWQEPQGPAPRPQTQEHCP
jgi:hypothetical protein